jgi:hypothetical protein
MKKSSGDLLLVGVAAYGARVSYRFRTRGFRTRARLVRPAGARASQAEMVRPTETKLKSGYR